VVFKIQLLDSGSQIWRSNWYRTPTHLCH